MNNGAQLTDLDHFYVAVDYELMIDTFKNELYFLKSSWQNMLGRPVVVVVIKQMQLGNIRFLLNQSSAIAHLLFNHYRLYGYRRAR